VTSDGGLLLVRQLDERLGLSELIEQHLTILVNTDTDDPQFPTEGPRCSPMLSPARSGLRFKAGACF
jgi:hypothetical protein